MLGHLDDALTDLNNAINLKGDEAAFYAIRGRILWALRQLGRGIQDSQQAVSLEPSAENCYQAGLYFSVQGTYSESLIYLDRAIATNPEYAEALTERGLVHGELGNFQLARSDYDKAIQVDPSYFLAWCNRAGLYVRVKEWNNAIRDASRAIALHSEYGLSYKLRAMANGELGNVEAAVADFNRFLDLDPTTPEKAWIESKIARLKNGDFVKQGTTGQKPRRWLSKLLQPRNE